jgi:hypothetical protein
MIHNISISNLHEKGATRETHKSILDINVFSVFFEVFFFSELSMHILTQAIQLQTLETMPQ